MTLLGDRLRRAWDDNRLTTAMLELTYACNLDCTFCYNDLGLEGRPLSLDQYCTLLDDLAALGALQVTLTGGEPLAHPRFFEIGRRATELGFILRIKSNGHALKEPLARRVREELDPYMIEVSFHGASPAVHDRQTRVRGSFERLVSNLRVMRELGLRVLANCTMTRWNEHEMAALYALTDELGIRLNVYNEVSPRDDGDRSTMEMEMILIDKGGSQRVRRLRTFGRDVGEDEQSILFFLSPADVEDTGFLTYDYDDPERDDDQWLYLPALSRTKRIASSDKSGAFMGSDFSYADMTDRPVDEYAYTLVGEGEVDGHPVWQIESVPTTEREKDETGYEKLVQFVRKDNYVVVRSVAFVKKGKRLKYFEVEKLDRIDGIWVATEMTMTTKKGKQTLHRTVLRSSDVRFGQDLPEDLFTVRRLEKGL